MTAAGWILFLFSWGTILGLCVLCFRVIFAKHAAQHLVGPIELEAEIEEEEDRKTDSPK